MSTIERGRAEEVAGGLDGILSNSASGTLRRFAPGLPAVKMAMHLARRPEPLASRIADVPVELLKVLTGTTEVQPDKKDKRFADPAWQDNPLLRRLMQAYLVTGESAKTLVDEADLSWQDEERMRFLIDNLVDALSPTNNPLIAPEAWKAFITTGGLNVKRGIANLVTDLRTSPRVPSMVDVTAFDVGRNLATTPGSVVYRDEVLELIQYAPQTPRVRTRPVMIVPPTINKFYVLDLAPGRSLVEHLVQSGQQVFMISWRNPDRRHAEWDMDAYAEAVIRALDATEAITGADATSVMGVCSGGIISALVLAHLATKGELSRIAASVELVTMLDQGKRSTSGALLDDQTARTATARSRALGYLDGNSLAEVFAWMRPNDLIWSYWVNNYLMGKRPPAFDILYWNSDATRMSAGLHADFVELARRNGIVKGGVELLGDRVDTHDIKVDSYVVAAEADHICPWRSCYSTTQLLGGDVRFILSSNGHIAALVNPLSNPKSSYRTGTPYLEDPDEWYAATTVHQGSWWGDFIPWLNKRSGPTKKAPKSVAGNGYEVLGVAPGQYVYDR